MNIKVQTTIRSQTKKRMVFNCCMQIERFVSDHTTRLYSVFCFVKLHCLQHQRRFLHFESATFSQITWSWQISRRKLNLALMLLHFLICHHLLQQSNIYISHIHLRAHDQPARFSFQLIIGVSFLLRRPNQSWKRHLYPLTLSHSRSLRPPKSINSMIVKQNNFIWPLFQQGWFLLPDLPEWQ